MMKRQQGLTGISILIIVIFLVFVASLALKVAPVYVDDMAIQSVVESFHNKADMRGIRKKEVLRKFQKRLKINNVTSLDMKYVSLKKKDSDYLLVVDYEPRGELIGNLEFIVHFHHEAKFAAN